MERFDAAAQIFSHCGLQEPDHAIDNLFQIEQFDAGCQDRLIAQHQASLVAKHERPVRMETGPSSTSVMGYV